MSTLGFDRLVKTLLEFADYQDKLASEGSLYASGKASAYRFAAMWLREEIEFYEKENR